MQTILALKCEFVEQSEKLVYLKLSQCY